MRILLFVVINSTVFGVASYYFGVAVIIPLSLAYLTGAFQMAQDS